MTSLKLSTIDVDTENFSIHVYIKSSPGCHTTSAKIQNTGVFQNGNTEFSMGLAVN